MVCSNFHSTRVCKLCLFLFAQFIVPYHLFCDLILYHLYNNPSAEESIRRELSRKLDAMICHERFTQYKTAATEAEREQARQRYLESIGMPADFRW